MSADGKYYGLYRAYVEDNKDPENQGRLKLSCPNVYGNEDGSGSPLLSNWAYPKYAIGGSGWGTQMVPPVLNPDGSKVMVWLEFEMGDMKYPIWSGCPIAPGKGLSEIDDRIKTQPYLSYAVLFTPRGNKIYVDDNDDRGCMEIHDRLDQYVRLSSVDGDEFIEVKDANGNLIKTNADGISLEDCNGNKILMTAAGIVIESATNIAEVATATITETAGATIVSTAPSIEHN